MKAPFSSGFHKEGSSSTVSAQKGDIFRLRLEAICRRVVASKTWNSQSLPDDECSDTGGSRQFSRVNCRGKLETRESAYRLPGLCGLPLQSALWAGWTTGPTQGMQSGDSQNHDSAASTGKCGTPERRRPEPSSRRS